MIAGGKLAHLPDAQVVEHPTEDYADARDPRHVGAADQIVEKLKVQAVARATACPAFEAARGGEQLFASRDALDFQRQPGPLRHSAKLADRQIVANVLADVRTHAATACLVSFR